MNHPRLWLAVVTAGTLTACSGANAVPSAAAATPNNSTASTSTPDVASASVNVTRLPVDDDHYTTSGPKKLWVYSCQTPSGPGGGSGSDPWVNGTTWNLKAKTMVEGAVSWTSRFKNSVSGSQRTIDGNGLPNHTTGIFPIASSDPAYRYDRNPNAIAAQNLTYDVPANPTVASRPSCVGLGAIGIMKTGAVLYNALDDAGRDAAVHEVLDQCWGHPQQQGQYHYHTFSTCMADSTTGHSKLLGYALDGFGIYGPRGTGGTTLSSSSLDECHGHTHAIRWNGKLVTMYHYHFTYDYPYSIACYRGTPAIN